MGMFFSTPNTQNPTSPATGEDMYFDYPFEMALYPHICVFRVSVPRVEEIFKA
jgi:hypothetical protein